MLQLEVGKYYKNSNGDKIGPIEESKNNKLPFYTSYHGISYDNNGSRFKDKKDLLDLIEEWKDEVMASDEDMERINQHQLSLIKSDGGATAYYDIPADTKDLQDIIEHKNMSFARGEAFKALYRLGEKDGTDPLYDINKIEYFAARMKARILAGHKP